jgi:hypothetical protein
MKKFNISRPEKYIDKTGTEKTKWDTVGVLTEFEKQDGSISRIIEIPAIGLKASIFEQKPREDNQERVQASKAIAKEVEYPDDGKTSDPEINIEDIPF